MLHICLKEIVCAWFFFLCTPAVRKCSPKNGMPYSGFAITCLNVHFSPTHDFSLGVLSYKLLSGTAELQILSHLFSLESNPGPLINGDYVVLTSL